MIFSHADLADHADYFKLKTKNKKLKTVSHADFADHADYLTTDHTNDF